MLLYIPANHQNKNNNPPKKNIYIKKIIKNIHTVQMFEVDIGSLNFGKIKAFI